MFTILNILKVQMDQKEQKRLSIDIILVILRVHGYKMNIGAEYRDKNRTEAFMNYLRVWALMFFHKVQFFFGRF